MIKNAVVFRHITSDGPGSIGHVLTDRNISMTQFDTFADPLDTFDALAPDVLVVMGGACGMYQDDVYPFLKEEMEIVRKRLMADRPTLGICLGAQMMAKALGEKVYPGTNGSEIGWNEIYATEEGKESCVRHFDASVTKVVQWHGDTFDLPKGAKLLASSRQYKNQIFQWGQNGLAMQCHIEATPRMLKSWAVDAAHDVAQGKLDLKELRAESDKWADIMVRQTTLALNEWLDGLKI